MNWFVNNPVADLPGPAFLALYALFAVAVLFISRSRVRALEQPAGQTPPVTTDRDPSEVAYLRGGGNELLRFTIFDLMRQGYLRICDPPKAGKPPQQLVQTGQAGADGLSDLQRAVVAFYAAPHTAPELFKSPLPGLATASGDVAYQPGLTSEGFFSPPGVRASATLVRLYGAFVLAAFAGYRLLIALYKGHNNVIFLGIEVTVALVALLVVTAVPRLSLRGRDYLGRLATALRPQDAAPVAAGVGVLPILIAATGMSALAGTEYAQMNAIFPKKSSLRSSGSCSACGSSSSDGGSGGSGCSGGCGG